MKIHSFFQLIGSQHLSLSSLRVARRSQLSISDYSVLLLEKRAHCVYLLWQLAGGSRGNRSVNVSSFSVIWHLPRHSIFGQTDSCTPPLCLYLLPSSLFFSALPSQYLSFAVVDAWLRCVLVSVSFVVTLLNFIYADLSYKAGQRNLPFCLCWPVIPPCLQHTYCLMSCCAGMPIHCDYFIMLAVELQ